ncbi:MAG: hypothetical protein BWY31_03223 [Lentisphaerae bacterium ADurb.Bin242]|nr:MAG: hypothetical protein BWY31_03223 [Lentisphaerae bacterium ADurb.Bin242]
MRMKWLLFGFAVLTMSLHAAPAKLILVGKDSESKMLVDRIAADQELSGDFEFLERQMADELLREQNISSEALRQCFPHADLLGTLRWRWDKTRKASYFEVQVIELGRGVILMKKELPEKKEGLLPDIIGCLKEANRKRNLPNPLCLSLKPIQKENMRGLAEKETLEYFEDHLMAALLSYDNVVLMERENLELILNEREFTQKTFMLAASSRIGKSHYFLGSDGKVAWEINISDFNGVCLGTVVIPDVSETDAVSLKEKCKPIVALLNNAVPGDPVNEAARYYEEYRKKRNLFLLFAACALDPENPVYRLRLYSIRLDKLRDSFQRSIWKLNDAKKKLKQPNPDAGEAKRLKDVLRMEPLVQQTILTQIRETADRMQESCRLVRSKYPEHPSLLKEYLAFSQIFSESGRNDKISAEDLYEEIRQTKSFGKPDLFIMLKINYETFYALAETPAIREVILKLLTKELEMRKTRKYSRVSIEFPHHENLKSFYASIPQEFLDRVKETKGQEKTLRRLLFLKLLCTPGVPVDELEREREKVNGYPNENIRCYNKEYFKIVKDGYSDGKKPGLRQEDSERLYLKMLELLRTENNRRKAFEMALEAFPPESLSKDKTSFLGNQLEWAVINSLLDHDDEIHDKVLRKIGSLYYFEKLADWTGARLSLRGDELCAFFPASREISVMQLPSGTIRKLGKLELEPSRPDTNQWDGFCAAEQAFLVGFNGEVCWFDRQSLRLLKKQKLRVPGVGIPSGQRMYIPFRGSIYSCSLQGDDWKTEFSAHRESPRFREETKNFNFQRIYDSGTPGVLLFHEGETLYRFDFNKEKIEVIEKKRPWNVLWRKGHIDILLNKGRILRKTTEVR